MESLYSLLFGRDPKAAREIMHPVLGKLVFEDEGWWKGSLEIDGQPVHFFIDDDGNGLEEGLDLICIEALRRFEEYDRAARSGIIEYVKSWQAKPPTLVDPEIFSFSSKDGSTSFILGFSEVGDSGRLWRVQFENSLVSNVGFDD